MSAPISPADIRKGDRIRLTEVTEFTMEDEAPAKRIAKIYELIERPDALPTLDGFYADKEGDTWRRSLGCWECLDSPDTIDAVVFGPFTLLRPVAEVAAEVLKDVRAANAYPPALSIFPYTLSIGSGSIAAIAAKFGVTK